MPEIRRPQDEQSVLLGDLGSLGLSSIRLNEFNDNAELRSLADHLKEAFLKEYSQGPK
ncbi:MAG: hypothetical protein ABI348_01315 [Nitrososphaera sp.]